jgi:transcription antitermination factor NusG
MKYWLVATYKINEINRAEINLKNQGFDYYLPKIVTKKYNSNPKEEAMFPGYIFINTDIDKCLSVSYTKGIKSIIKFGEKISYIANEEIKSISRVEKSSRLEPLVEKIEIGQEVNIKNGSFKGNVAKICSLPSNKRVGILLHILGSSRRIDISEKDLIF